MAAPDKILPCAHCGTDVPTRPSQRVGKNRYCSRACYHAAQRGRPKGNTTTPEATRSCVRCGETFTPFRANRETAQWCSKACYRSDASDKGNVTGACADCGAPVTVARSKALRSPQGRLYCPTHTTRGAPRKARTTVPCTGCETPVERPVHVVEASTTGRFFCSSECRNRVGAKPRRQQVKTCATCSAEFYPRAGMPNRFCSTPCHDTWQRRNRPTRACRACGASFSVPPSSPAVYCSAQCYRVNHATPVGTRKVNSDGYVLVFRPDHDECRTGGDEHGWALEHRVFMSDLLGRSLEQGETVHHRNGDRSDNTTDGPLRLVEGKLRSGNLELWNTAQPPGQHIGDKLEWARALIAQYGAATVDDGRGA